MVIVCCVLADCCSVLISSRWARPVESQRMRLFIDVRPLAGHRGMTVGVNESRFVTSRVRICGRESGVQRFSQNR